MHAEYFHDNLAFAESLLCFGDVPTDECVLPASAFEDAISLAAMLADYAQANEASEPRAIASQWSKFAFARLVIPTVVVQCCSGRAIDFSSGNWTLSRHADGTPARFVFTADPLGAPGTGHDFSSMIDAVMRPLIGTLCQGCRLAPRVYSSNAAMYFVWALDQLKIQQRGCASTRAAARALTITPSRPDGGFNPFHQPFKSLPACARDGQGQPATECRRLCCVRDLDPAWALCPNCPRAVTVDDTLAALSSA